MKYLMNRLSHIAGELMILALVLAYPLNKYLKTATWIDNPLVAYFVWVLLLVIVFRWLSIWFSPRLTMHEVAWICRHCVRGGVYYSLKKITDLDNDEPVLSEIDQDHGIDCTHENYGVTMYTFPSKVSDLPGWFQFSAWWRVLKLRKIHVRKPTPPKKDSDLGAMVRYLKKIPPVVWTTSFAAAGILTAMFPGVPLVVRMALIPILTVFIAGTFLVFYIDSSPVLKTDEAAWCCPKCKNAGIVPLQPSGNNALLADRLALVAHSKLKESCAGGSKLQIFHSQERVVDLPAACQFKIMMALAEHRAPAETSQKS